MIYTKKTTIRCERWIWLSLICNEWLWAVLLYTVFCPMSGCTHTDDNFFFVQVVCELHTPKRYLFYSPRYNLFTTIAANTTELFRCETLLLLCADLASNFISFADFCFYCIEFLIDCPPMKYMYVEKRKSYMRNSFIYPSIFFVFFCCHFKFPTYTLIIFFLFYRLLSGFWVMRRHILLAYMYI